MTSPKPYDVRNRCSAIYIPILLLFQPTYSKINITHRQCTVNHQSMPGQFCFKLSGSQSANDRYEIVQNNNIVINSSQESVSCCVTVNFCSCLLSQAQTKSVSCMATQEQFPLRSIKSFINRGLANLFSDWKLACYSSNVAEICLLRGRPVVAYLTVGPIDSFKQNLNTHLL